MKVVVLFCFFVPLNVIYLVTLKLDELSQLARNGHKSPCKNIKLLNIDGHQ
tara:strand:+ start:331 stop:483 length:153 start_codon:yes stop_codon:yes gene_type:complete